MHGCRPAALTSHHHARAMTLLRLQLLLLLLAALAGPSCALSSLVPDNIFYRQLAQDQVAVFAPGVQFGGKPLRNTTASSAEACAQLCHDQAEGCDLFNFVGGSVQVTQRRRPRPPLGAARLVAALLSCPDRCCLQAGNGTCTLLSLGCAVAPTVATPPAGVASSALTAGGQRAPPAANRCCSHAAWQPCAAHRHLLVHAQKLPLA